MTKQRPGRPRLRLFVALDLPPDFVEELDRWRADAYAERPAFRVPAPSSLHVTLVFLGYKYERDLERVVELAFSGPGGRFELQAKGMAAVPPRRPRLHALELEDSSGGLMAWQADISQRLTDGGLYVEEKRPFRPHVTVARAKRGREREAAGEPPALPADLQKRFRAQRATLYSSTLSPAGAIYQALAGIDLV